ncbi:MAG: hypothetical protein NVSMB25_03550 [Thermoleophilaceae bacterium]
MLERTPLAEGHEVTAVADGAAALMSVEDQGSGLAAEAVELAFGRFWRGSLDRPGSGLGLAIVAATARRHGGSVSVDGARFTLDLPAFRDLLDPRIASRTYSYPEGPEMLRRLPTNRLLLLCALVVAIGALGVSVAAGAFGGATLPPPRPLPQAIHAALSGPPVAGVSAHIEFRNNLIDSSSLRGSSPLITGATGRLFVGKEGMRLELQSSGGRGAGDTQILVNGRDVSVFDVATNTVYRATLPPSKPDRAGAGRKAVPTIAQIKHRISQLLGHLNIDSPKRTSIGGQQAYSVRFSPRHDAGLLGSAQLGFDALRGVPLSAAIYAQGNPKPVLSLVATNVRYGPVSASDLVVKPPASAKVVQLQPPAGADKESKGAQRRRVTGLAAVRRAVPFTVSAPPSIVGLPRRGVRLLDLEGTPAAIVSYGKGLGGVVVIQRKGGTASAASRKSGDQQLPSVKIGSATGTELATALGTLVTFERGGVMYTVVGSVPPAAAEAVARAL